MRSVIPLLACIDIASVAAATDFDASGTDEATFSCTGQVAIVCGGEPLRLVMLIDGESTKTSTDRSFWLENDIAEKSKHAIASGDVVALHGNIETSQGRILKEKPDEPAYIVKGIEWLGKRELPSPRSNDIPIANNAKMEGEFVRIHGVISEVARDEMNREWNWFILRTMSGQIHVATPEREHSFENLRENVDAEVDVLGIVLLQRRWRRFNGTYILPIGPEGIVVKSAAKKPCDAIDVPLDTGGVEKFLDGQTPHRMKISGIAVAANETTLYIQTAGGAIVKVLFMDECPVVPTGSHVCVAGFVSSDFCGMIMTDTAVAGEISSAPPKPPPKPPATKLETLFEEAKAIGNAPLRRFVTIEGVVVDSHVPMRENRIFAVEENGYRVNVDISAFSNDSLGDIEVLSKVRVTGICDPAFKSAPVVTPFPRFEGFNIIPASVEGIAVLSRPPWWTARRLALAVLSLLGILAVVTGLAVAFRVLSMRRGQQLYEERASHLKTEAKVEERTRLAVELHDAISQTLTGVALQVDSAVRANGEEDKSKVATFLNNARMMLSSCRKELQDCLWDLRSRTLSEKNMTEAINRTIAPHRGETGVAVRFNVARERLTESETHAILSIVRELVVNAIRHGKAKKILIAGEASDGEIRFSVRDNGCGFDAASAPGTREGHFGLQGVRERVNALDGSLSISSHPGKGTRIDVSLRG